MNLARNEHETKREKEGRRPRPNAVHQKMILIENVSPTLCLSASLESKYGKEEKGRNCQEMFGSLNHGTVRPAKDNHVR